MAKPLEKWKAEVMAVGDEIITGQRLDTNTQWLSQALGDRGIAVRFHSSVGDDLEEHINAIKVALGRADLVVMTGGLGPTADDLTRQAIADAAGVGLVFSEHELTKIESIFLRTGRQMPFSNRAQAYFPEGTDPIPNPEGTAPGIDLIIQRPKDSAARLIALPGVPAEMKQMWFKTVDPRLKLVAQSNSIFHHHSLNCFGAGESTIESLLPNLVQRGRDPSVGITASHATISLRVTTRAASIEDCRAKMLPTIEIIKAKLGELVFGENQETLADVVVHQLTTHQLRLAICDLGLNGKVFSAINEIRLYDSATRVVELNELPSNEVNLDAIAKRVLIGSNSDIGVVIGPIDRDDNKVLGGESYFDIVIHSKSRKETVKFQYGGHSAWRDDRAVKQVLNQIRLFIRQMSNRN